MSVVKPFCNPCPHWEWRVWHAHCKYANMIFNFMKIDTITGCDTIIVNAQREKEQLEYLAEGLTRSLERAEETAEARESELANVNAQIVAKTAEIAALPEGNEKLKQQKELNSLDNRRITLELRLSNDVGEGNANRQIDLAIYEARITALDEAIVALEARKVEIQNAA